MLATIICVGIAIACLTQGAVEGAIAMGILAVIVYFLFGSQALSKEKPGTNPIRYFATTSFCRDNQYRWNRDTHTWEKLTKL